MQQNNGSGPLIAAVISTRNRGWQVVRTIESVLANDYPNIAVVVVDQSDDDSTWAALQRFCDRPEVTYIRSSTRGLSAARNEGIRHTDSELIAFTDDDCEVDSSWLRRIVEAFDLDKRIGVVFGTVKAGEHDQGEGFIPAYYRSEPYLARGIQDKHQVEGIGACMGVRRGMWRALHGFDESFGAGARFGSAEELDFAIRTLLMGFFVYAAPRASVVHNGFRTWADGRNLISDYLFGIGAMFAKLLKLRHWSIFILMWHLGCRWAFAGPVVDLGHKPPRILRLKAFVRGFFEGMSVPVNRRTGHFPRIENRGARAMAAQ